MGKGGEIFVLDMGDPVKIFDLASSLIILSGLRPGLDIEIKFTGTRPGEKLYEELAHMEEECRPTFHEKIKIFSGNGHQDPELLDRIEDLRTLAAARDLGGLILQLKDPAPDYTPSAHLLKRALPAKDSLPASA